MNLASSNSCNFSFTIKTIVGFIFHNFFLISSTSFLRPRLWTTRFVAIPGISSYVHANMDYFSFKMNTNDSFPCSVKDFSNWMILDLVGSSLILTSMIFSITICDPFSNWLGIGIQVLSFASYSYAFGILFSIKNIDSISLLLICSIWIILIDISWLNK